ncbi:Protein translocase subunit SecA, partial [Bienertia sinuspersici]
VHTVSYSGHHFEVEVLNGEGDLVWMAFGENRGVARSGRCMDDFRSAMDDCALRDLGYMGNKFTWQRGLTEETMLRGRLDRFMACDDWCSLFPSNEVCHFPIHRSDHAPIMLQAGKNDEQWRKGRLFKFEAYWLSREECEEVVRNAWQGSEIDLGHMQSYWYARARANDLKDGDRNTTYFHRKASAQHLGREAILLEGLKWRVGDGRQIGVWDKAWLPEDSSAIVPTPREEDANLIRDIPLIHNPPSDERFWWPNKDGIYTVKSGYRLGLLGPTTVAQDGVGRELWRRGNDFMSFSALAWAAWTSRNKSIFENENHDPMLLAVGYIRYVHDHELYVVKVIHRAKVGTVGSASEWTRPPSMVWKINTDAAIMEDGEPLLPGVVCKSARIGSSKGLVGVGCSKCGNGGEQPWIWKKPCLPVP